MTGWEKTRNRDCLSQTAADVFVRPAASAKLSGSHPNRLNWLPFKSALTPIVLHEPQATMRAGTRTSSACTCRPKPTSAQSWLLPTSALFYGTNEHDVLPARHRPHLVAETRARTDARGRCPETEAHRRGTGSRTECRSPIVSSERVTPPQIRSSTPTTASARLHRARCHTHARRAEDDASPPIAQRTRPVRANSPLRIDAKTTVHL
jgi:hypothetical protein